MEDTRYSQATLKLINGLISLLQVKDFLDINVKELCLVSKVNRTTFYAHYDNTFELLQDSKKYMVDEFLSSYKNTSWEQIKNGSEPLELLSEEYLIPYLRFIRDKRAIYETYTKNSLSLESEEYLNDIVEHIAKPVVKKRKIVDDVELYYVTRFYIIGIDAIVQTWIKRGFKEDEEYLASLIASLRKTN